MQVRRSSRFGRFMRRVFFGTLGLTLATAVGTTLFLRYQYGQMGAGLAWQRERAKRNGIPLSASELQRRVPTERNAAPLYVKAIVAYESLPKKDRMAAVKLARDLNQRKVPIGPGQDWATLQRVQSAVLPIVEQAVAKPDCAFARDWSNPVTLPFPEFSPMKDFVHLLAGRALLRANEGDTPGAVSDIRSMVRLAEHSGSEPTLISALVRIAERSIARRTLENVMSRLPARQYGQTMHFNQVLFELKEDHDPLEYLRGEPFFGVFVARNLRTFADDFDKFSGGPADSDSGIRWEKFLLLPPFQDPERVGRAYETRLLSYWNEVFEQARMKNWKPRELGRELDLRQRSAQEESLLTKMYLETMFPVFSQFGEAVQRDRAYVELIKAARDVFRFRSEKGRFPRELAEASQVVDPYSDKLVRYRQTDSGFMVYSVGRDGVDNGGLKMEDLRWRDERDRQYDEVFEIGGASAKLTGAGR